jgi:hypothetical protein
MKRLALFVVVSLFLTVSCKAQNLPGSQCIDSVSPTSVTLPAGGGYSADVTVVTAIPTGANNCGIYAPIGFALSGPVSGSCAGPCPFASVSVVNEIAPTSTSNWIFASQIDVASNPYCSTNTFVFGTFGFRVTAIQPPGPSCGPPPPPPCNLSILTSSLGNGTANVPYSQSIVAQDGTPPYTWTVLGLLPDGLVANPQSNQTFLISGTPTQSGQSSISVQVTDSLGCKAENTFPLFIFAPYFSETTKEAYEQAAMKWGLIANFFRTLLTNPVCDLNPECAETAEAAVLSADAAELVCTIVALDPADPNFTVVAQPVFAPIPTLPKGIDEYVVETFNLLVRNENMQLGYFVAMKTALNRSQGAAEASNATWQETQLLAAKKYAYDLAGLQEVEPFLLFAYEAALQANHAPLIPIDPAQVNSQLQNISQNGFPTSTVQVLEGLGFSAYEVALVQSIPLPPPISSAPSYPQLLVDSSLLGTIKQVRTASLPFIADRNNDLVVNCSDLQIVRDNLGKHVGETGFDPRADVNGDGVVNWLDFLFIANQIPHWTSCNILP